MLVALSGVQGSGKTTVLNGLKELGYNVIERKTARSVLADWNMTLEQVYADQPLSQKFHDELLYRKESDEHDALCSPELYFTERSYADLFTYALVCLGHFNPYSEWLNAFYESCKTQNNRYLGVFFLDAPHDRLAENDGVRGINPHYVKQVNDVVTRVSKEFAFDTQKLYLTHPLLEVNYALVDQRVRFVAEEANSLWLTQRLKVSNSYSLCMDHPISIEQQKQFEQWSATNKAVQNI